jgi:CRP-like cAMP-binding protein
MRYKSYKKGDKIITQNSQYEGIYFIINGKVKINVCQTYNELSNTLVSLQYPVFNFKEYVSKIIKTIDIIKEFNLKYIINNNKKNISDLKENEVENEIFSSNEYFSYFQGINDLDFYTLNEGDIVGLNELYDFKTELYNFNAECISDEAILFFISKNDFNNVMKKDSDIRNNVIHLIDFKAKALIGKINLYRNHHKNLVIKILKNKGKKVLLIIKVVLI